jgi:folate-binding protein YgfZ
MENRRSPLLNRHGAVAAEAPDSGVAAHYGDPMREQRRLDAGEGFTDLSHREVVRVSGPDRLPWLHVLTTQHVENLAPHEATEALILSPNGHIEYVMYLVDDGEATWMHVEPGTAAPITDYLEKMKFWKDVTVEDVTEQFAVVFEPVAEPHPEHLARVLPYGRDIFLPRPKLESYEGQPAGVWAYEALRIAAHRPRLGRETDHRTIVQEVDWVRSAVHLQKGCYRGQETVARVHNLGKPPRRLVFLHLDGMEDHLPPHGTEVLLGDRKIGFVTSSARHFELGPIALALVKRNTAADAVLTADGVPATQDVIVPL